MLEWTSPLLLLLSLVAWLVFCSMIYAFCAVRYFHLWFVLWLKRPMNWVGPMHWVAINVRSWEKKNVQICFLFPKWFLSISMLSALFLLIFNVYWVVVVHRFTSCKLGQILLVFIFLKREQIDWNSSPFLFFYQLLLDTIP